MLQQRFGIMAVGNDICAVTARIYSPGGFAANGNQLQCRGKLGNRLAGFLHGRGAYKYGKVKLVQVLNDVVTAARVIRCCNFDSGKRQSRAARLLDKSTQVRGALPGACNQDFYVGERIQFYTSCVAKAAAIDTRVQLLLAVALSYSISIRACAIVRPL